MNAIEKIIEEKRQRKTARDIAMANKAMVEYATMREVLQSGEGWKTWAESGGGYRDAFLYWLKDVNAALDVVRGES